MLAFALAACGRQDRKRKTYHMNYETRAQLIRGGSIILPLDTLTSNNVSCVQFYSDRSSGRNYISFLNMHENTIYFYDFLTHRESFRVKLEREGPDGVGKVAEGFFIHSLDSILVSSRYRLSVVDSSGKVRRRYNLAKKFNHEFTALPQVAQFYEPVLLKQDWLLTTAPDLSAFDKKAFRGAQCLMRMNKFTGEFQYQFEPSDLYQTGVYGPNYASYYNCNNRRNLVVFSFPADPLVYTFDFTTGRQDTFYAGSKDFDAVRPMDPVETDFEGYTKFYIRNPSYGPIIFDPYRRVYYRFALTPLSEADYAARRWWKNKSLIILDSTFNKIGETSLTDSLSFLNYFVSHDGLYVAKSSKEDEMEYVRYVLEKK